MLLQDLKTILANEKFRYCIGCGCNLLIKICLTMIFGFYGLSLKISYLCSHALILIFGFIFHYFVTFRRRFEGWGVLFRDFGKFAWTLLFIKALDYFLVVIVVSFLKAKLLPPDAAKWVQQIFNGVTIGMVCAGIFILRFFLYRMVLRKNQDGRKNGCRYAVSGVAFSGNKGAEGMLLALVQNIRKLDETAEFRIFSYYPATDRAAGRESDTLKIANAGPKHVLLMFFPALWTLVCRKLQLPQTFWKHGMMKQVASCDVWLDAAGISFCDGREKFTVFNILTIFPALAAGVKVIKVAQALGPFEHKLNRLLAKLILPHLAWVVARGAQSRAFADELKLDNISTFSDSAFSLDFTAEDAARAKALLPVSSAPKIGISPSQVVFKLCEKAQIDYCGILRDVVKQCAERGWHCILFAHSARSNTDKLHNNDLPLLKAFAATLPPDLPLTVLDEELEAGELRALIGELDVLVASRFHAIISAMATGVPAAVIGWSHKYEEVLAPFELAESVQSYAEFSAAHTLEIVSSMLNNRDALSRKILTESRRIAEENRKFFELVVSMAKSKAML